MDHSVHDEHAGHEMGHSMEPAEHRLGSDSDGILLSDDTDTHIHQPSSAGNLHSSMMSMFFHFGVSETILFQFWKTNEVGVLLASMVVIFLIAFSYEALKFYREHLYRKSFRTIQYNTVTVPVENGGTLKETQKTVQIGTNSLSVDPEFATPEITPIFISQGASCSCPRPIPPQLCSPSKSETGSNENETKGNKVLIDGSNNNHNLNLPNGPVCNMRRRSTMISTNVSHAYKVKMMSWMHTWQTVLHVVQVILSYLLMLIFMTYNVWLCLAVVLGAGAGYFFFGWKKSLVVDITEHCH